MLEIGGCVDKGSSCSLLLRLLLISSRPVSSCTRKTTKTMAKGSTSKSKSPEKRGKGRGRQIVRVRVEWESGGEIAVEMRLMVVRYRM